MKLLRFTLATATTVLPLAAAPIYSVVNLGGLGGSRSEGLSLNQSGVVAGVARTAAGSDLPVVFGSDGVVVLAGGTGQANGINSSGRVTGTVVSASGAWAAVWSGAGAELLPTVGGAESYGLAINDLGDVAGSSAGHAFLYADGLMTDLGTVGGGTWSSAYAVTDSRQVAGYSSTAGGGFQAFVYDPSTGMRGLAGLAAGGNSYAFGLNAGGVAVGAATDTNGYLRALWYAAGNAVALPSLGGTLSSAYGINAAGQIVGYGYDPAGESRALVWINGFLFDLNALVPDADNWIFEAAYAINDAGQIVGKGRYRGEAAAFRLDPFPDSGAAPVPEPASATLWLAGASVLTLWRMRRRKHR